MVADFECTTVRASECTGETMLFAPEPQHGDNNDAEIHDLRASGFEGKVMSLFCEASRSFSPFDPVQTTDVTHEGTSGRHGRRRLSSSGGGKSSRRSRRRHTKRLSESTADAYHESQPSKASLLLNPWKPDPSRSRTATTICGDGLFYAAGGDSGAGGCIDPGHKRSAEVEAGLEVVDVID
jgi:hypothetical protein